MICEKCGAGTPENEKFCTKCQKKVQARTKSTPVENFEEQDGFYSHSGKIGPQLIIGIPILAVIIILLSAAYAYGNVYLDYFYAKLLLAAGFIAGVGFSTGIILQFFKTRNTVFAVCFGFIAGLFAVYSGWVAFIYVLFNKHYPGEVQLLRLFDPVVVWWGICDLAENLKYTVSGITVSGAGLWSLWAMEAVAVIGFTVLLAHKYIKHAVFCETCSTWAKGHETKFAFEYLSENELKEKLVIQDMSFLDNIIKVKSADTEFYRIKCKVCKSCKSLFTMSLVRVARNWDGEGKMTENESPIIRNLIISKETFDLLTNIEKVQIAEEADEKEPEAETAPETKTAGDEPEADAAGKKE